MLDFLRKLQQMPYHIRKKVLNRVYSVIMYSFLLITLFPIFWMIYTSFMSNNEIIQGKISYQRAPYNVIFSQLKGNNLLFGTSDGAVSKYDIKKNKVLKRRAFKTNQTNYKSTNDYLWLSSADSGLIRINKKNFNITKKAKVVWNDIPLDFNKISKTLLAVSDDMKKVWLTIGYQDYDKIFEFNINNMQQTEVYSIKDAFSYSFEKLAISDLLLAGNYLYIATNRGIAKFDLDKKQVEGIIESDDFSAAEVKSSFYDQKNNTIYFASATRVYSYSPQKNKLKQIYYSFTDKGLEQIGRIVKFGNDIILTTGQGVLLIDINGKLKKEVNKPIFDDIDEKGQLIRKGIYVNSDVTNVEKVDDALVVLGTSGGRISFYNIKEDALEKTILVDRKSYLKIYWRNYIDLFNNINFGLFLKNSFVICGVTALISMLLATITAYALVRFPFPGNRAISTAILSTQMIPGVMTLIPIYIMFIKFTQVTGIPLKGTYAGMIFVYSAFFLPFSIWILRGFFASIPVSLEEAATIDGCSPFQVFWRIALPLSIPGIVATGIFIFLVAWDELVFAWVLSNAQTMTIPVGIRLFVGNFQNRYDLLMAASTVSTIPVLIMFAMLQKQIVSGLTAGAVKQ